LASEKKKQLLIRFERRRKKEGFPVRDSNQNNPQLSKRKGEREKRGGRHFYITRLAGRRRMGEGDHKKSLGRNGEKKKKRKKRQ